MEYEYDKDQIKQELTLEQVAELVSELGGEPIEKDNTLVCKTICHCGQAHKLYYYGNSCLFKCYTDCGDSFDIYDLVKRVKIRTDESYNLPKAIDYVAQYFGYTPKIIANYDNSADSLEQYWDTLRSYERIKGINKETQRVELKVYDDSILKNLPKPRILNWEEEGITKEVCDYHNICYDAKNCGIVIPHYNEDNKLVGIRERTLIGEQAELYGKYMPARIHNKMYNHPLSFNLYNYNWSKENIKRMRKAIVFESEKSCLQYASMFGKDNDISVACCGSSLISYQVDLIKDYIDELIVGFDHDFNDIKEENAQKIIKKYKNFAVKYGNYLTISFIWDRNNLTQYKASPTDGGKDIFIELFKERVNLYEN